MDDRDAPTLLRREQSVIVLLALLQGLLLYVAEYADEQGWALLSELKGQVPWYTLVLIVPTVMQLMLKRLDDRRFWENTALAALAFGAVAAWATWSVTGAAGTTASALLGPFGTTLAITAFVATPYLQVRLARGRFSAPYTDLFELAWQNALTLKVVGVVVGVGWLLLMLWRELFVLIGIDFFRVLFSQDPFIYLVTGLLAGLGVLVARTQVRAMQVARQVLFAIFTGFLPLAAFIAVLFLISLPFTGLEPLTQSASTAATLATLIAALVLLVNAVVQTGRASPYPRFLRVLIDGSLLALPIFAGIALHAMYLRIDSQGWTSDRFWALVAIVVLTAYSLGYAWAVVRPGATWLSKLPRVNVVVSVALIALGLLANSPVLDPHRLAVNSQVARIEAASSAPEVDDSTRNRLEYLRFESGRRGVDALATLPTVPDASGALATAIKDVQARAGRYDYGEDDQSEEAKAELARRINQTDGAPPLPEAFLAHIASRSNREQLCHIRTHFCGAYRADVNLDGQDDIVLCQLTEMNLRCLVYAKPADDWQIAARIDQWQPSVEVRAAVRRGDLRVVPPAVQNLQFGGSTPLTVEQSAYAGFCTERSADAANRACVRR